jgi:hypothetical protein
MADFGLDTLSDAELGQLAAHVAAASADARAQAGADMTDAQRDEINTIEMDAQEQWLRDRQETHGMNEPAAGYDDGENQAIPGGGRQAWLKRQAELRSKNELPGAKRIQWWTDVGHKPGKANREKTWLWAYDKQGKLQVINAEELRSKMLEDTNAIAGQPTHLDWEELYHPGLLAGTAHGRIDATGDVIRVSLAGRISDDTFRQQVKQELAEYIGADVDKVKGYDFSGDGMPEVFEPGPGRRRNSLGTEQGEQAIPLDDVHRVIRENETMRILHRAGRVIVIEDFEHFKQMADELGYGDMTPLELHNLYHGGAKAWFDPVSKKVVVLAERATSEGGLKADLVHEIAIHMIRGANPKLIKQLAKEILRAAETDPTASEAIYRAAHAMLTDPDFAEVVRSMGGKFAEILNGDMGFEAFKERFTVKDISDLFDASSRAADAGNGLDSFHHILAEEINAYLVNAREEARNAPEGSPERKAMVERWYQRLWSMFKDALRNMFGVNLSRSMHDLDRMTEENMKEAADRFRSENDGQEQAPTRRRYATVKREGPGGVRLTDEQLNEAELVKEKTQSPPPGSPRAAANFKKAYEAATTQEAKNQLVKEALEKIGGKYSWDLDGKNWDMPQDVVDAIARILGGSEGEYVTHSNITDASKAEALFEGARGIKPQGTDGAIVNGSEFTHDGRPLVSETSHLLGGREVVIQVGSQAYGNRFGTMGYGFLHGVMRHWHQVIHRYALATMKPGQSVAERISEITTNNTEGIKAYGEAIDYFIKNADSRIVLKDADGNEKKITITDTDNGFQMSFKIHGDKAALTTGFAMTPGLGMKAHNDAVAQENSFNAIRNRTNEATYKNDILGFEQKKNDAGTNAPGTTVHVELSDRFKEADKPAEAKAAENAGEAAAEPSAETPEAQDQQQSTGEAVNDSGEPYQGRDVPNVSSEVGGTVDSPAPSYPPPIPPSPPAPPGAAPLNPELSAAHRAWDVLSLRYFSGISVKAHQNARRFPGASIQAVADIIHNRPGSQGSAAPRSIPLSIMTARGRFTNQFRNIMAPMREHLGAMTVASREAFYEKLTDMITGRRNMDTGFVGQIAENLKKLLADLHTYRLQAGEDLGEIQDYFPVVYNSDMISKNRSAFLADAERAYRIELSKTMSGPELDAMAAASALALYNTHVRGMGEQQFNSLFDRNAPGGRENSARERVFGRQAQNIMRRWQSNDPFLVITRYIGGAVKSAELARKFGADGTGWERYAQGMEKEGVPHEVIDEMHQLVCQAAGVATPSLGRAGQGFMDGVALYTAATALGKSFISNLFEPVSMGQRTGSPLYMLRAYGETWVRTLNEFAHDKAFISALSGDDFWKAYGEHIGTIHNSLEDAWMTTHSMELGMDNQNPRVRWLTNRIYKANLMDCTEVAKQCASHALGHSYILDLCDMMSGKHWMNHLGMDPSRSASFDMAELGIPEAKQKDFILWMERLRNTPRSQRMAMITEGSEMSQLYEEAQVRFTHQSAVRSNRAHRPVMQDNLMGKMFLQLQSFSYSYAAEANSRIYDNAKRAATSGDATFADRIRLIAPLLMAPFAIAAFAAMFALRKKLFPTEATKKHENDPWWATLADAASYAGVFGPKVEQSMKYVMRDQPPGGIVGQEGIGAARTVKAYGSAMLADESKKPAAYAAANKAAVRTAIPPVKGALVAGAAAINPTLGTAASMFANDTTLSNAAIEATQPEKPDKKREEPNPYKHRQEPRPKNK